MSFKSREKKRAIRKAQQQSRAVNSKTSQRHFLTIVSRACSCNECGGALHKGREMVYRHTPREALCPVCADKQGVRYRLSLRWEKNRKAA